MTKHFENHWREKVLLDEHIAKKYAVDAKTLKKNLTLRYKHMSQDATICDFQQQTIQQVFVKSQQ